MKENMLDLLNGIFKRTCYVYNLAVLGQRNYTHTKNTLQRERKFIMSCTSPHRYCKVVFFAMNGPRVTSPSLLYQPSPIAFLVKLLSLVSIAHPCTLSDMNCPGIEAPGISSSALQAMNRTDCQAFLLQLHRLALIAAEKLQTLSEGFGPFSQAPW